MTNLAEIVLRFLSDFSFKKLMSLAVLISIFFLCILLFDRMTATLSLYRIERSLTILERLNNLDTLKHPELTGIKDKLTEQLSLAISPKPFAPTLSKEVFLYPINAIRTDFFSWELWSRLLASFVPWLVVLIVGLSSVWKAEPNSVAGLIGTLICGAMFALLGLLLPNIWWISFIAYPIGHFIVFVGFIMLIINYQKNKIKKETPQNIILPTIPTAM